MLINRLPFLTLFLLVALRVSAQITVEGVSDKNFGYIDTATFRVLTESGYEYDAWLNGNPVPLDTHVTADRPDYYELFVQRVQDGTGTETTRLVRFIVKSSNRGSSERGLIEWTPYPLTPSAASEFSGAQLHLMLPQNYPQGLEIPVIAMVDDGAGNERRVNGAMDVGGHALDLIRGHGSLLLPPATNGTPLNLDVTLHSLSGNPMLDPDDSTTWTTVSGTLAGATAWPTNSRIHLTGNITIPSTAHLTVEAGTVVKLDPLVNIYVDGRITMNGDSTNPVVWAATGPVAPEQHAYAWGGFLVRGSSAVLHATGTILFGGGGATSFNFQSSASHRPEQPVLFIYDGAEARMTNCAVINTAGQVGNGYNSELVFDHCLFQRAITAGEYTGSSSLFTADHCAFIEFPSIDGEVSPAIADGDYDALYFTEGEYILRNSLIGFCKDDAIDAGSGGAGTVTLTNCWVEAALHEALAWSGGGRETWTRDTVLLNSGQGIECGYSSGAATPLCHADNILALNNSVGARFGDNYNWSYNGQLDITNSLLLHNYRDILGREWNSWNWRTADMDIRGNRTTTAYAEHPDNTLWNPATDAAELVPFMATPPDADVGIGIALWTHPLPMAELADGVPVRLSSFTTNSVSVDYEITDAVPNTLATGTLVFAPGETLKHIVSTGTYQQVHVVLDNPINGELTGLASVSYTNPPLTIGFASTAAQQDLAALSNGLSVVLSSPAPSGVGVDYSINAAAGSIGSGTLGIALGETLATLPVPAGDFMQYDLLQVVLGNPTVATLRDPATIHLVRTDPPPPAQSVIAPGASWRYWDAGTDLGTTWRSNAFNDSAWPAGPAQLGFGEGDEATVIADNNQITTYFRHTFTLDDPAAFADLSMWMLRDDGAVVYLNGTELFRSPNMPAAPAPITYSTPAETSQPGENTIDTATLPAAALLAGTNVVAVEMHQTQANSSDVSFDFELLANPLPGPQRVYLESFGGEMVIAWRHPGFILEETDDLTGSWTPAATNSPLIETYEANQKFYRLRLLPK